MSAMPRLLKSSRAPERDPDRAFHLGVREAILVFLRAYERRYLPDIRKTDRQPANDRAIE